MNSLPKFAALVPNYPVTPDYQSVLRSINPALLDMPAYQNTCAMRLSMALNGCPGHEIPKKTGLETIHGLDGKRYAIRVQEMKNYLRSRYLAPGKTIVANDMGVIDNTPIQGKKGIIAFDVAGWSDASGHFTLWDGFDLLYAGSHDYFNLYMDNGNGKVTKVTKCYIWFCP